MRILFVILIIVCFLLALASPDWALSKTRPAPRHELKPTVRPFYPGIKVLVYPRGLPPHWRQWLKTCRAEQPRPGTDESAKWHGVWWNQTKNYTYKGGCGFTQLNWGRHKRKGQPKYMSDATPLEQLWACERIYQFYTKIGGPRYGASVWDANKSIGFFGFSS